MTSTTTIASAASSRLPFVALLCSSFLLNSLIQPQHSFMVLGYSPNIWSPSFAHKNNDKKNNIDSSLSLSSSQNTDDDQSYYGDEASNTTTRKRRGPIRRSRPATGTKSASAQNDSLQIQKEEVQNRHRQALKDPTLLSNQKFNDRTDISPNIKRAITEVMGLSQMTEIQSQTYRAVISGDCVLGRARTGTGKTLAFLLPTIERLLAAPLDLYIPGQSIGCIIVAPTRELAIQIADQAEQLLTYYSEMNVACIYGGTKIQRDYRLLSGGNTGRMPAILVATPGRLLEHLENNSRIIQYGSSRQTKFRDIIDKTQIVILDEADRLFEGFYKDTTKILSFLPRSAKRQTLLFSATLPQRLKVFLRDTMKINFANIDCVADKDNDVGRVSKTGDTLNRRKDTSISSATANAADKKTGETNIRVDQTFWELESMDEYITALVSLIYDTIQTEENYKIIVFFPASKLVRFFSQFFNQGLGMTEVLEIHSRMSQSSRQKASSKFRASTSNSILFTSDVSQRGVDYPDVSHVIQYGAPSSVDAYIHRLGRTGRAGRQGKGILVLLPFEKDSLKRIKRRLGSNIQPLQEPKSLSSFSEGVHIQDLIEQTQSRIRSGHAVLTPSAEAAYSAFLAYYMANNCNSNASSKTKKKALKSAAEIVDYANQFSKCTGLMHPPTLDSKTVSRIGIEGLVKEERKLVKDIPNG